MVVLAEDAEHANAALAAAFAELETIESVMSLYRPESQVCRLNREGVLDNPHPELVQVLQQSQQLAEQSGGAFDITVQPLWSVYAAAAKEGRLPDAAELAAARALVDWRKLEIAGDRIRMAPGMAVTLNGIAQGFAADRALAALRRYGIQHALINTGELGSLGCKDDGQPWIAGIQHPRVEDAYVSLAQLDGRCLATSGDYATTFTADREANHIVDPRTGRSPPELASVSVLAPDGLLADGLSTALFVLGVSRGQSLLASIPGTDAMFVLQDGRTWATAGFPELA